ncbi:hypothetical protein B7486_61470, partial [cyanobacterium TDX16]
AADPAFADDLAGNNGAANRLYQIDKILGLQPAEPGGRLTLTSGSPVSGDVAATSNVYYCPYKHNRITLWDGTRWVALSFSEVTMTLSGMTANRPYDVFAYISAGALAIERLVWTSDSARATGISLQDGRYCKTGDKTRLYLGTFYASSTTETQDTVPSRFVWNMYHRVERNLSVVEGTNSWTYTTATWRSANSSTANRVQMVRGLDEDAVRAHVWATASGTATAALAVGVGLDSTSANSAQTFGAVTQTNYVTPHAIYCGRPGIGLHYLQWLEISEANGTVTWYGDAGVTMLQSGLVAGGLF